jgi:hypothetical protein
LTKVSRACENGELRTCRMLWSSRLVAVPALLGSSSDLTTCIYGDILQVLVETWKLLGLRFDCARMVLEED